MHIANNPTDDLFGTSSDAGGNSSQLAQYHAICAEDTSCDEQTEAASICTDLPTIQPEDARMDDADRMSDLASEAGTLHSVGTAAPSLTGTVASLTGSAKQDFDNAFRSYADVAEQGTEKTQKFEDAGGNSSHIQPEETASPITP